MALFDRGPQGPAGPPGGEGGTSFLTGHGTPSDELGNVGDHYVNTGASPPLLYGPKTLGGWGDPVELGGVGSGISVSGTGFVHATAGDIDALTKKVDLSSVADIANILGVANGGTGKTTSDLSGQAGKAVVVNGTNDGFTFQTFPTGASVPTGNGFRKIVAGVEQPAAAAVNLASSIDVTGVLPRANQQDQNLVGDVGGTTGANTVNKIQGVAISGTPVAGYTLTATSPTAAAWEAPSGSGGGGTVTGGENVSAGSGQVYRGLDGTLMKFATFAATQPLVFTSTGDYIAYGIAGLSGYGSPGQSMRVQASGIGMEWYTPSSGGTTSPGGASGQLQINNAGVFGGLPFGTANYLLAMNSSANGYTWVAPPSNTPAGTTNEIQIRNSSGAFATNGYFRLVNSTLGYGTMQVGPTTSTNYDPYSVIRLERDTYSTRPIMGVYTSNPTYPNGIALMGYSYNPSLNTYTLAIGSTVAVNGVTASCLDNCVIDSLNGLDVRTAGGVITWGVVRDTTGTLYGSAETAVYSAVPRLGQVSSNSPFASDGYYNMLSIQTASTYSTTPTSVISDMNNMDQWNFPGGGTSPVYYNLRVTAAAHRSRAYKKTLLVGDNCKIQVTDGTHTTTHSNTSGNFQIMTLVVNPDLIAIA